MNERHSDSSGLPLRAMVMVLLFLGVVFLLVGFQAMGSGDDSSTDDSPVASVGTTSTPSPTPESPAPAAKADVRVYNISEAPGVAEGTATHPARHHLADVLDPGGVGFSGRRWCLPLWQGQPPPTARAI